VALKRRDRSGEVAAHAELEGEIRVLAGDRAHERGGLMYLAPDVDAQRGRWRLQYGGGRGVGDLEQLSGDRQQAFACRGQPDPVAAALDQRPQPRLQARDALRECLLGQRKRPRRPPEVLMVDQGDESPDLG
jgi:hypothetical protein